MNFLTAPRVLESCRPGPGTCPATTLRWCSGRHLHHNETLGVYVLHARAFERNPAGMFEDWNPRVTCPSG
jgi:hypothetical protein